MTRDALDREGLAKLATRGYPTLISGLPTTGLTAVKRTLRDAGIAFLDLGRFTSSEEGKITIDVRAALRTLDFGGSHGEPYIFVGYSDNLAEVYEGIRSLFGVGAIGLTWLLTDPDIVRAENHALYHEGMSMAVRPDNLSTFKELANDTDRSIVLRQMNKLALVLTHLPLPRHIDVYINGYEILRSEIGSLIFMEGLDNAN